MPTYPENTNLQMNGRIVPATGYGIADAKLELRITYGIPPYKIHLKINDTAPMKDWNLTVPWRVIDNIPLATQDEPWNCIVDDLPTGKYKFRIYDSTTPTPQMNLVFADWFAKSPPYSTIHGIVNPMGIETTVSFEYGETEDFGFNIQAGKINGNGPINVNLQLSGGDVDSTSILKPNTLYYYRVKAVNVYGIVYGETLAFETPAILPIVTTLPATDIE